MKVFLIVMTIWQPMPEWKAYEVKDLAACQTFVRAALAGKEVEIEAIDNIGTLGAYTSLHVSDGYYLEHKWSEKPLYCTVTREKRK